MDRPAADAEPVLDAVTVSASETRDRLRPARRRLPMRAPRRRAMLPAVQAAAVAAGGFVAGAAVVGLVTPRARSARRPGPARGSEVAQRAARAPGSAADRRQPLVPASTCTCSAATAERRPAERAVELRGRSCPPAPSACRGARRWTGRCAAAAACSSACCTTASSRCWCAWPRRAGGRVLFGARAPSARGRRYGIARMRFALGVDDDLRPFLRRVRPRPADRQLAAPAAVAARDDGARSRSRRSSGRSASS